MAPELALLTAGLSGAATWTLAEYLLHRFVFHGPSAKRVGAKEHRQHHAQVDYFAPWWQKAGAAGVVAAAMLPAAVALVGRGPGLAYTLGFVAMYVAYEVLHRRAHTHGPRGRYGRWLRRNHFAHHFVDPKRAHGVTSPVWDVVFGTRLETPRVRVPRRLALPWLIDSAGDLRPAFAGDYELAGAKRSDPGARDADREAAMANRAPPLGAD